MIKGRGGHGGHESHRWQTSGHPSFDARRIRRASPESVVTQSVTTLIHHPTRPHLNAGRRAATTVQLAKRRGFLLQYVNSVATLRKTEQRAPPTGLNNPLPHKRKVWFRSQPSGARQVRSWVVEDPRYWRELCANRGGKVRPRRAIPTEKRTWSPERPTSSGNSDAYMRGHVGSSSGSGWTAGPACRCKKGTSKRMRENERLPRGALLSASVS
jgi:hypothetical protein